MSTAAILPILTLLAAAIAIAASLGLLPVTLLFIAKPLATALIIVYACGRGRTQPEQRRWTLIGLVLSLVGDVCLLWPREGFLPGLVAFLFAHLAYIRAFSIMPRFFARPWPFVAYGLIAAGLLAWLWPGVPAPLRVPVIAYVICLASMAAQAAATTRVAAIGGALFLASDALLAINKFAVPFALAPLAILATYWAAQWCIASALPPRGGAVTDVPDATRC